MIPKFVTPTAPSSIDNIIYRRWSSRRYELGYHAPMVYTLPEMSRQALCDILEPPAVNQLSLLCQWCSQASWFNKSIEVSQFALKAFFDTVPFSWLLAMVKWWIYSMIRNKVFTVWAKIWSAEVLSEGLGFCLFEAWFSNQWFESCQNFDEWIKAEIFTKD